jgi:dihydroxyacetone kinase
VEFGLGIHGESGCAEQAIAPVDTMLGEMLSAIMRHGDLKAGDEVALMDGNGLGGTPIRTPAIA